MISIKEKIAPFTVAAAAACVLALAGCGNSDGLTGGVAATVNGTDIPEDQVTEYIMDLRDAQAISNDRDWANWLNTNGLTPDTLRTNVVDMFVSDELVKQTAASKGIEVTEDELNEAVQSMKSNYENDEAWQKALSEAGLTEEKYRENVRKPMLQQRLLEKEIDADSTKASDEEVISYANMYAPGLDGMKRSSHILFAADDEATAQQVLDQINAGADFAELAKQYSTDTGSAENGGDVGWDGLNSFVEAYTEALKGLDKGQTSGLVTSEYGIHIIRCTDVYDAPEEITSLDQVPEELVTIIRTQMADPAAQQTAYSDYLQKLRDNADVHVNDMPSGVPYNVDMARYVSSSTATESGSGAEVTTEGEASGSESGSATEGQASESEAGSASEAGSEATTESASTEASESSAAESSSTAASEESK